MSLSGSPHLLPTNRRLVVTRRLPADETAARAARTALWHTLTALKLPRLIVSDCAVMLSELVANALTHARGPYLLRISRHVGETYCEVIDHGRGRVSFPALDSAAMPNPEDLDLDVVIKSLSEHGRGLGIVLSLSAGRCGSVPVVRAGRAIGKSVWFAAPTAWGDGGGRD